MWSVVALVMLACAGRGLWHTEGATVELPVEPMAAEEAGDRLWRFAERPAWREPSMQEAAAIGELVEALIRAAPAGRVTAEAAAEAAGVGMAFRRWSVDGQELLVLQETERRGAGAWLARVGAAPGPLAVQAPHPYYDTDTGRIGLAMWLESGGLEGGVAGGLFATSTLQRYTDASGERVRRDNSPADPCHNPAHLLHLGTLAAAAALPELRVVQLHGFGGDDVPEGTAAVVSGGRKDSATAWAAAAAGRLDVMLGGGVVRLYPDQASVLGATTNVQGIALRQRGGDRFLHIEMSKALRERLRAEAELRRLLAQAIQ